MSAGRLASFLFLLLLVQSRQFVSFAQEDAVDGDGLGDAGLDSASLGGDDGPADLAVDDDTATLDDGSAGGGAVADASAGDDAEQGDVQAEAGDGVDDIVPGNAEDGEPDGELGDTGAQTSEIDELASKEESQQSGFGKEEASEEDGGAPGAEEADGALDSDGADDAGSSPTSGSTDDADEPTSKEDEELGEETGSISDAGSSLQEAAETRDDEPQELAREDAEDTTHSQSSSRGSGADTEATLEDATSGDITAEDSGSPQGRSDSSEEADLALHAPIGAGQDGGELHAAHGGRRGGHRLGHLNTAAAKQSPREVIQNRYINPGGGPHGSQSFSIARRAVAVGEHMDVTFDAVVAKTRKHVAPHVGRLARSGYEVAAKTHKGIQDTVSHYVGPEHTPLVSTVVSYVALLTPLLVSLLIILRIRAMFSIQKVVLFANLYLTAYCATLVLTTCLIGVEPLATLQRSSESNYVVVQLVEAFGYILYMLMQLINLGIMSSSGCCTRFAAVLQICLASGVGLHYYLNVWQPAMLDLPPSVSWQMYGGYALVFLACCFMSRVRAVSKTDTETLLVGSDKKL
eukprot:jgi/Mesvir1/4789/Mv11089-RA.1